MFASIQGPQTGSGEVEVHTCLHSSCLKVPPLYFCGPNLGKKSVESALIMSSLLLLN